MNNIALDSPSHTPSRARLAMGLVWAVAYIVAIVPVFLLSGLGGQWLGRVSWPGLGPLFHGITWMAGALVVTWLFRVKANKAPWSGMALPRLQWLRLLLGAVAGFAVILIAAGIEHQLGWLHIAAIDLSPHRGVSKLLWIVLTLVPSLAVGLAEELGFRGYLFVTLGERMPVWAAALLMSVVFGLLHFSVSGFSGMFVFEVTLTSMMFLALRYASGSLWFPIGFHGAWDWTQTYFVGLATTGTPGDPALVRITQTGPALWVGDQQAIESGLIFLMIDVGLLILALMSASAAGRSPPWLQRLARTG